MRSCLYIYIDGTLSTDSDSFESDSDSFESLSDSFESLRTARRHRSPAPRSAGRRSHSSTSPKLGAPIRRPTIAQLDVTEARRTDPPATIRAARRHRSPAHRSAGDDRTARRRPGKQRYVLGFPAFQICGEKLATLSGGRPTPLAQLKGARFERVGGHFSCFSVGGGFGTNFRSVRLRSVSP